MERTFTRLEKEILDIYKRDHTPAPSDMIRLSAETNALFMREDSTMRPHDESGLPGGIIILNPDIPSILVPDIHARLDFFLSILMARHKGGANTLRGLFEHDLQIVCLGDGMHSEGRAYKRWDAAAREFLKDYREHANMDDEMRESLGVMEMVMILKNACPLNFHFLKGNHENVANEDGNGNHPYLKYAFEGDMVSTYLEKFYGMEFIEEYYRFEKNLPILAVGKNFLASHAEPASSYYREEIINYRTNPVAVEGLTWTDNGASESGSVACMLAEFIGPNIERSYYFGGHRPIDSLHETRADGKFIQIHNPERFIIAKIDPVRDFNIDEDIVELENHALRIPSDQAG